MGFSVYALPFDPQREKKRGMDKLQWGSRKRLRCVKVKETASSSSAMNGKSEGGGGLIVKKKITSRVDRRVVAAPPTDEDFHNNRINNNNNQDAQAPCSRIQSPNRFNRQALLKI